MVVAGFGGQYGIEWHRLYASVGRNGRRIELYESLKRYHMLVRSTCAGTRPRVKLHLCSLTIASGGQESRRSAIHGTDVTLHKNVAIDGLLRSVQQRCAACGQSVELDDDEEGEPWYALGEMPPSIKSADKRALFMAFAKMFARPSVNPHGKHGGFHVLL